MNLVVVTSKGTYEKPVAPTVKKNPIGFVPNTTKEKS